MNEVLLYYPLIEEDTTKGWNKDTIEYLSNNRSKVYDMIRKSMKGHYGNKYDIDDIFGDLVEYMYRAEDYSLERATNHFSSASVIPIEGYINKSVENCVKRYFQKYARYEGQIKRELPYSTEDGKELNILDTVPDNGASEKIDEIVYDIEDVCKSSESYRYVYGVDIYMLWFIRLLLENKESDIFNHVTSLLDCEIHKINKKDSGYLMSSFAKAINTAGTQKSIGVIKQYVYSADKVEEVVKQFI